MSAARSAAGGSAPLTSLAGRLELGGEVCVNRVEFGAMRLPGVWEGPQDPQQAHRLLRRAIGLGVNFIDTAHTYGPSLGMGDGTSRRHRPDHRQRVANKGRCGLVHLGWREGHKPAAHMVAQETSSGVAFHG